MNNISEGQILSNSTHEKLARLRTRNLSRRDDGRRRDDVCRDWVLRLPATACELFASRLFTRDRVLSYFCTVRLQVLAILVDQSLFSSAPKIYPTCLFSDHCSSRVFAHPIMWQQSEACIKVKTAAVGL